MQGKRTCGLDCPHHYHNHPKVKITHHDLARENVSEALASLTSQMLATELMHPGHFGDFLDMLPIIGKALDTMRFESPDLKLYMAHNTDTQENAMRHQAELARRGDVQTLRAYSDELERTNPLPIIDVTQ